MTCVSIARPVDRGTIHWIIECGDLLCGRNPAEEELLDGPKGEKMNAIMKELGMDEKQLESLHGTSITSTCRKIVASLFPSHLRTTQAYSSLSSETSRAIRGNSSSFSLHQYLFALRLCALRPSRQCQRNN